MDLLKQCQQWFKQDETQKVIDALEAIPAEKRTPELDSELAKAYIAIAEIGEAANWPRHTSPLRRLERQDGRSMKRLWNFWNLMRSILPKITAGITGSLPLIICWMRKVPPCVTLKRP